MIGKSKGRYMAVTETISINYLDLGDDGVEYIEWTEKPHSKVHFGSVKKLAGDDQDHTIPHYVLEYLCRTIMRNSPERPGVGFPSYDDLVEEVARLNGMLADQSSVLQSVLAKAKERAP
jgi:hypothetical protein